MPLPRLRPSAKTNGEPLARIRIGAAGPDGYPDLRPLGFPFHFAALHALYLRRIPDRKQVASARCPRKIQGQLVLRRGPAFGKNAQTLALCAQRRQMRGKADRKIIHHANPQMMLACAKRKMHARVLVARVRRRANRYRSAVKQSVPHVRSQTHRRGEVHLAVAAAPAALRIQGDFLLRPSEAQRPSGGDSKYRRASNPPEHAARAHPNVRAHSSRVPASLSRLGLLPSPLTRSAAANWSRAARSHRLRALPSHARASRRTPAVHWPANSRTPAQRDDNGIPRPKPSR